MTGYETRDNRVFLATEENYNLDYSNKEGLYIPWEPSEEWCCFMEGYFYKSRYTYLAKSSGVVHKYSNGVKHLGLLPAYLKGYNESRNR